MRNKSSVTSISWIPSEAVQGVTKVPFETGVAHYDDPPPDHIESLESLRGGGRFPIRQPAERMDRGARRTYHRTRTGAVVGTSAATTLRLGGRGMTFAAVAFPDERPEPVTGDGWVRFSQTSGGRTGVPVPRKVNRPPFVQVRLRWHGRP